MEGVRKIQGGKDVIDYILRKIKLAINDVLKAANYKDRAYILDELKRFIDEESGRKSR